MTQHPGSAEIEQHILVDAAKKAVSHYKDVFEQNQAKSIAEVRSTKPTTGFLFWKRPLTEEEIVSMAEGYGWSYSVRGANDLNRAEEILHMAETANLLNIRLSERSIHLLSQFLGKFEA
jgi:hypothetical protein